MRPVATAACQRPQRRLAGSLVRAPVMRTALLELALVALLPLAAGAQQTGRIVGKVTASESGAAIGEAQVFVPGTGLGGLTRQNGAFVILEVPVGVHEVRAERIGLSPVS